MTTQRPRFILVAMLAALASACATVDLSQPAGSAVAAANPAFIQASNDLMNARSVLVETTRARALAPADADIGATAKALNVLVHGWKGDEEAQLTDEALYLREARRKSVDNRRTLAAVISSDIGDITRAMEQVAYSSDAVLALEDTPSNLMREVAAVEKSMAVSRSSLRILDGAILTAYQGAAVPVQITDAREQMHERLDQLVARADALAALQGQLRSQQEALG